MKAIAVSKNSPTLRQVLDLAGEENVVLKTSEGRRFVLAEIDDFEEELAQQRENKELMAFLDERSRETTTHTLQEVRESLLGTGEKPRKAGNISNGKTKKK